MMSRFDWLCDQLAQSGFLKLADGVFSVVGNQRVIALVRAPSDPSSWEGAVSGALRNDAIKAAPSWSRYVVLVVSSSRTSALAAAAASFSHDVSKCRRLAVFEDSDSLHDAIPFLPLPFVEGGASTPVRDLEAVVRSVLSGSLADNFIDTNVAVTQLQRLAEEASE